ncbi:dimer_Tnp_hAT domain-containing protein [Trichonephila clavipes]|nr:dimer_Tnp_hAT domain-containing protein [Trichonephila clavipes]
MVKTDFWDHSGNYDTPQNDVLKYCKDLETVLTNGNSSNINTLDLADETVAALLNKKESPIEILKFRSNLDSAPNLGIVLRILLTLPVNVASGEGSFSKLKLIKKFLRSSTTEDRLNGLTSIANEHELAEEINIKEIIRKNLRIEIVSDAEYQLLVQSIPMPQMHWDALNSHRAASHEVGGRGKEVGGLCLPPDVLP